MRNLRAGWLAAGVIGAVAAVLVIMIYARSRRDIRAAREHVQNLGSQVIGTDCGPIEYATYGEGHPVLVVHGIFGGFDQGLVIAQGNGGQGFRSTVPSRFGYLRTPLPDDPSPAGQADAYACLLDALGIQQAAIMGTSAGGTSAIQFALRHPDRCSSLVLFSASTPGETEAALPPQPLAKVLKSDFIFWLMTTYLSSSMRSTMGVPEGFELTPEHKADIAEVMVTILPVHLRADGAWFDMYVSNSPLQERTVRGREDPWFKAGYD